MIQSNTILNVCDNSGVRIAKCIKVLKKKKADTGDLLIVSIVSIKIIKKKIIKKGDIFLALVIRSKKSKPNLTGILTKFNENSICLLNKQKKLIATRIYGPIPKKLKKKKMLKTVTLSSSGFY